MKLRLLFTLLIAFSIGYAQQIPEDIKPPSWSLDNLTDLVPYKLPAFDLKKLQDEDAINDQNKSIPWRFGHDIYVDHNFNNVGEWTTLANGDRIWRMAYTSKNAYSINFMFDVFKIPVGAKLYVYNKEKTDLLRPFTYHNNNPEEVLGTWLVEGDSAWIEYYQPANVVGEAKITVGSVIHGYRTAKTYEKSLGDSGNCNFDVDCDISPSPDPYGLNAVKESIKTSGALILRGSTEWCSGTLINNTNNDGTPYIMTANHCGGSEGTWSFRFNWRSPNPSCGTTVNSTDGTYNQTVSGATLRASSAQSDMELVEINDTSFFENNTNLVWVGWNRSTTQVPAVNFGFHHPSGDIQKVSRKDGGGFRTTYNDGTNVWRINDWDLGVTEGGSSGSGLFNETGHLIGTLYAGTAGCSGTNDNGGYDVYGRFDVAWDYGTTASTRLKDWLDPSDSGIEVLDQYPSLVTYDLDATVNGGSNNASILCIEDFAPDVTLVNEGLLTLTSADITYNIDDETSTILNWTGNLPAGESTIVATPTYTDLDAGSHAFSISVSNPNGIQDDNTTNNTFGYSFTASNIYATSTLTLDILTDSYGYETSWELLDSSGAVVSNGPSSDYGNLVQNEEIITITNFNECYTFTIFDAYEDGICCDFGPGAYSLTDDNGNTIISGGEFNASESVSFGIEAPLSISEFDLNSFISIYPNPTTNILNVDLINLNDDVDYQIFNTLGQRIQKGNLDSNTTNILNLSPYQSGIYFIKLSTNSGTMTQKLIKK